MANWWRLSSRLAMVWVCFAATSSVAQAQNAPDVIDGNGWIAIAVIIGLVALVALMISGAISVSSRDKPDGDGAGFGVLEGIDDDEDKKK